MSQLDLPFDEETDAENHYRTLKNRVDRYENNEIALTVGQLDELYSSLEEARKKCPHIHTYTEDRDYNYYDGPTHVYGRTRYTKCSLCDTAIADEDISHYRF